MAKKVDTPKESTSRKLNKSEKGSFKGSKDKYYQLGNNVFKTTKNVRIFSNKEVIEHDTIDSLSVELKMKQKLLSL